MRGRINEGSEKSVVSGGLDNASNASYNVKSVAGINTIVGLHHKLPVCQDYPLLEGKKRMLFQSDSKEEDRDIERRPSPIIEMTAENILTYEKSFAETIQNDMMFSPKTIKNVFSIKKVDSYNFEDEMAGD